MTTADIELPAHVLTRVARYSALLTLEAVAGALALWSLLNWSDLPRYLEANLVAPEQRSELFLLMLVAWCMAVLVAGLFLLLRGAAQTQARLRQFAPLAPLGLLPMLCHLQAWQGQALEFLLLTGLFGLALWYALVASLQSGNTWRLLATGWRQSLGSSFVRPLHVVVFAAVVFTVHFARITLVNHYNLNTLSFDLGLEDNLVWNIANGGPWFKSAPFAGPDGTHFGNHATFFSYLIALVYRFAPQAETLLVIQSVLAAAAAIPLYLLARCWMREAEAAVLALAYLAYPPLHGSLLYDFHYQPLAIFFLWMVVWAVEVRRHLLLLLLVPLALSVREDVGLLLAVLGAYLLVTNHRPVAGLLLAVLGTGYFVILKFVIMPQYNNGVESFLHQYHGLMPLGGTGFSSILQTIVGNPSMVLKTLLVPEKFIYALQILVPLAAIPLLRTSGWLCLVPGFLFTLMATGYAPLYQISFQYTAYWTSCLFIALAFTLRDGSADPEGGPDQARAVWRVSALLVLVMLTLLSSVRYGAFIPHDGLRGGFNAFQFGSTEQDHRDQVSLRQVLEQLPAHASVAASEQLVAQVSNRPDAYTLRKDIFDAEYLLFMMPLRLNEHLPVIEALQDGDYGVTVAHGRMVLAKRGHAIGNNQDVLRRILVRDEPDTGPVVPRSR